MNRGKSIALVCGISFGVLRVATAYETLQGPTETRYWDEAQAWNGYTLFGARGTSYLIDMEGRVVRTWPVGTNPRLLDNGDLLDASTDDPSHGAGFIELDWDANTVWEYHEDRDDYEPHHDFVRIFNKDLSAYTTLYIANKTVTHDQAIAASCDPANGPYDAAQMDAIVEVNTEGEVVWEWWFFDHVVQDFDPLKANYVASLSDAPGRIDVNLPGRPVRHDWLHCNSLDYNAELDQIVVNSVQGEFYVIDHGATFVAGDPAASIALAAGPAGDFLYRFGDPARYEQGDPPSILEDWTQSTAGHKQIGGAHDVQWIKPGLPGAGHFLIFNNGQYLWERCPQSYIFEINGFLNAAGIDTGGYVNPPDAGYSVEDSPNKDTHKQRRNVSKQITWMYYSKSNQGFFSHIGSGAQRLPNGNTLICAMTEGHILEVTSDGALVWEYVNPVTPAGKLGRLDDNWPMYNSMFRAYRYTADHPALAGRDLTPGDTISGTTPSYTHIPDTNGGTHTPSVPVLVSLAGGTYEMGDHHDLGGGEHANDEIPVHTVHVDPFQIGKYEVRCDEYVEFLNSAVQAGALDVRTGLVYQAGTDNLYCETRAAVPHSRIGWDGIRFSVLDGRAAHPATGVRWLGAAAYCNWLSSQTGREPCYDLATGACDWSRDGIRLPSEAEWEFAARGGLYSPYRIYPWGDVADTARANWPDSGDPYEVADYPRTTPVGFYDASLRQKADFGWPSETDQYQTEDGSNGYGLYDVAGNVWEWVNDWYARDYYDYCVINGIVTNPPGPAVGTPAPDGEAYHALRGGNWYNGEQGHSRVSNRNLAYYRGPDDPNHAWYHVGFRIAAGARNSTNAPPAISGTAVSPLLPSSADSVWVTATVADDDSVAQVSLTYADDTATGTIERTAFSETMRATAAKPWRGDSCDNAWTVTATLADNVEQRTGANYGPGNPCGAEFHLGTVNLTDTMIATSSGIDATGTSGFVEFWIQPLGLTDSQGWTFQVDAGGGYVTRLSELTGASHAWQQYQYALAPSELVTNLRLRFQFRGGAGDPRVDLDQISVKVTSGGGAAGGATVAMYDDGAHQDGSAGDGRYGAQIPARPAGTTVTYCLRAVDSAGAVATDPADAPAASYSYTVRSDPTNRTVGLITNTAEAFGGYTLIAPKHYTSTYLINNDGQMVHSWTSAYEPGQSAYLLPSGDLLRCCFIQGGGLTGGGEGGRLEQYAWDGSRVWELDYSTPDHAQHHDICPLPNGNVLMLAVERKTYTEVLQAGFNPSLLHPDVQGNGFMMPDSVIEVRPTRPSGGTIVWAWHVWDHLIQDYDRIRSNFGVVADHPERIDVNGWVEAGSSIHPFWNHMNSIAYNPDLDQIMLSVRGSSELWVIDHSTTTAEAASHAGGRSGKGGDLLYRWGNPVTYDAPGNQMLFDQHDAQWIDPACPGAGNMLIFNNGLGRNYSSVDESAPPAVDANGNYALASGEAYAPSVLAWSYTATPATSMYAEAISGCQRLPNGNTLICDGTHGELREVSTSGQIVWFYTCPVQNTGPMTQGETPSLDVRNHQYNAVFKVRRYPASYTGLQGKDLTPRGAIELSPGEAVDADADTMADVWEVALFGNTATAGPLTDSDGDGLTDLDEYRRGTRPDLADTDGDMAPDGWETLNGLDPASGADGQLDSDGDQMTNLDEYLADTGPRDPLSVLALTGIGPAGTGIELMWIGGRLARQYVECSSDLMSGQWSAIFTNEPPTAVTNSIVHQGATPDTCFYRIKAGR